MVKLEMTDEQAKLATHAILYYGQSLRQALADDDELFGELDELLKMIGHPA